MVALKVMKQNYKLCNNHFFIFNFEYKILRHVLLLTCLWYILQTLCTRHWGVSTQHILEYQWSALTIDQETAVSPSVWPQLQSQVWSRVTPGHHWSTHSPDNHHQTHLIVVGRRRCKYRVTLSHILAPWPPSSSLRLPSKYFIVLM